MARDDISWVRTGAEGKKLVVYAHQVGDRWDFFWHAHRHDDWEVLEQPTVDDWREVLDAVRRRAQRNLYPPDAPAKLERTLRRQFPGEEF